MADERSTGREHRQASWEAHWRQQLCIGLAASPAQRLAWLEEVIAIAYRSGALPRDRDKPDPC